MVVVRGSARPRALASGGASAIFPATSPDSSPFTFGANARESSRHRLSSAMAGEKTIVSRRNECGQEERMCLVRGLQGVGVRSEDELLAVLDGVGASGIGDDRERELRHLYKSRQGRCRSASLNKKVKILVAVHTPLRGLALSRSATMRLQKDRQSVRHLKQERFSRLSDCERFSPDTPSPSRRQLLAHSSRSGR